MISLEPWDAVWRRNQHLSSRLVSTGRVDDLLFVEPPKRVLGSPRVRPVQDGISAATPNLLLPKSAGGLRELGRRLRRGLLADLDLLWVNDPALGVHCRARGVPVVYDVTDDWRCAGFPHRIRRRIVRAEDRLVESCGTIVCSVGLQERWRERYGITPPLVQNGIDIDAWQDVEATALPGPGPHLGYVGTLHEHRLDVELMVALARAPGVGTVHLVGPDALRPDLSRRLAATPGILLHGAVPAAEVPGWMTGMDVLISPHKVNDFTLSLDAIKAHEYAASGRPVVATPTSGFERREGPALRIASRGSFVAAVLGVIAGPPAQTPRDDLDGSWEERAVEFWKAMQEVMAP